MTAPYVTVGRGKSALLAHLRSHHGQVEPSSPAQWNGEELDSAHRSGHRPDGVMTQPHTHEAQRVGEAAA